MPETEERVRTREEERRDENIRFGFRLAVSTALHPLHFAKTLIQLGYEPIPPKPGKSMLGQDIMALPNVFTYITYLKDVDGFVGCYRGLVPRLFGTVIGTLSSRTVEEKLGLQKSRDDEKDESELSDEELYKRYIRNVKRDVVVCVTGIVVSQPFNVVSVRMMASFVGREEAYKSMWSTIKEIWRNEGIFGFFGGLVPKLICDTSIIVLTSTAVYFANKYFIKEKDQRSYFSIVVNFILSGLFYPFNLVSTNMMVAGGKQKLAVPYTDWTACFGHLRAANELNRGSSLFWRRYRVASSTYKRSLAPMPQITRF